MSPVNNTDFETLLENICEFVWADHFEADHSMLYSQSLLIIFLFSETMLLL